MITSPLVIDGHNDLAWACRAGQIAVGDLARSQPSVHTDLDRLQAGGVGGQFWSVWVPAELTGAEQVTATLEQIDLVQRMIAAHPDRLQQVTTAAQAREVMASGRIASLIGIEGGAQIDGSLAVLRSYARMGARYLTLTWSRTIEWADSATDEARHGGLTDFGRSVVAEMNRIGMLVDLSHVAPSVMRDALEVSTLPVFASHSGALACCDHPRNVPDESIKKIAAGGGLVMVPFVPSFVSQARRDWVSNGSVGAQPPVGVADVADHLDHIRTVAGIDAVGIGADFDGTGALPDGLADVSSYPTLLAELSRRGWSDDDVLAVSHRNVLRVLEASDPAYLAFLDGSATEPEPVALRPRIDVAARVADERAGRPRVLVVVNADSSGPRRLQGWLESDGLRLEVRRGADGLPASLDAFDGVIVLGGPMMPDDLDAAPWLADVARLVTQAVDEAIPALGICLGGQVLAHVAGGEVRAAYGTPERGAVMITTTAAAGDDALFAGFGEVAGEAAPMIEHHRDQITRLPEGAVHLARSADVELQAFRLGECAWGLQFHPEASARDLRRWNAESLAAEGLDRDELHRQALVHDDANTVASRRLFAAFAAVVSAAADRRQR